MVDLCCGVVARTEEGRGHVHQTAICLPVVIKDRYDADAVTQKQVKGNVNGAKWANATLIRPH